MIYDTELRQQLEARQWNRTDRSSEYDLSGYLKVEPNSNRQYTERLVTYRMCGLIKADVLRATLFPEPDCKDTKPVGDEMSLLFCGPANYLF